MASKPRSLLFGLEVEFGFVACDEHGERMAPDTALWCFFDCCAERLSYLPGDGNARMYLANGSLLYPDGGHPELATAESTSPVALLQSLRAGETHVARIAEALEARDDISTASVYRSNVDYSEHGTTWGCHESYLSRRPPSEYAKRVVPHLVSRIVYTGAGGFNSQYDTATFVLSPRTPHLNAVVSADGGGRRAIFSLRNEPLAECYHRVHLICGEPNCSELATYLKIGATALVLAVADADVDFGIDEDWIQLPLDAMRKTLIDPTCATPIACSDGRRRTAIEIQRHYLELAEGHRGASFMPDWAEDVCIEWRRVLDELEADPHKLTGALDWPTKLALLEEYVRGRSDMDWDVLKAWSRVATHLALGFEREWNGRRLDSREAKACLAGRGGRARMIKSLTRMLDRHGLHWDELDTFYALRDRLCELDMHYGRLYPRGIHLDLEQAGAIRGRILEPAQIDAALDRAPEPGRARVRGDWIRRLAGERRSHWCTWTAIANERSVLDLQDPFVREAEWSPPGESQSPVSDLPL